MTERPERDIEEAGETRPYRSASEGGPEPGSGETGDYRDRLSSRRWNAAPLENPEVEKTDPRIAVAAIAVFSVITFIVLVVGYGIIELWSVA